MVGLGVAFSSSPLLSSSLPNRYRSLSPEETAETRNLALAGAASLTSFCSGGGFYGMARYASARRGDGCRSGTAAELQGWWRFLKRKKNGEGQQAKPKGLAEG